MNSINIKQLIIPTLVLLLSACHKAEMMDISEAKYSVGQLITSDTLTGTVKGTLQSGKTYYFSSDIRINKGDTLLMLEGSKLIALGDGKSTNTSPQITCSGTFISLGSPNNHNFITVPNNLRNSSSIGKGYWGGIQCSDTSGDLIIKWTHIEFAGGPPVHLQTLAYMPPAIPVTQWYTRTSMAIAFLKTTGYMAAPMMACGSCMVT